MKQKLVECVPNISEGRDRRVIDAIVDAARIDGVQVLDVDAGADTHRTVITLLGSPQAVEEGAFRLIARSAELIDMSQHQGEHPRMGATDVCPFVPVAGTTMAECVEISRRVGARVGEELRVPVYLYEHSASRPERRSLAAIRSGEYEALPQKLCDPLWRPDYGPALFQPRFGALVVGAREFLIAYNINLNSRNKAHAQELAGFIRETGHAVRTGQTTPFYMSGGILRYQVAERRFPCGNCLEVFPDLQQLGRHLQERHQLNLTEELLFFGRDPALLEGQSVMVRGKFRECRAVGWVIPEYQRAQISINLTHYKVTAPHQVLEECRALAMARGLSVTGSEIVGMVPCDALRIAGDYYLQRQGESRGIPLGDVLETAVQSLGLRDVHGFDVHKSVLGIPAVASGLAGKSLRDFTDEVSRATPAPGGGSVAALAGALAAALAAMVGNLTFAGKGNQENRSRMEEMAIRCQEIKDELLQAITTDAEAFNEVIIAMKLPKGTAGEVEIRDRALQSGYQSATRVPLATAELCLETLKLCREAVAKGLKGSVSDAAVGGLMAHAAFLGAVYNVKVNLKSITDTQWVDEVKSRLVSLVREAAAQLQEVQDEVDQELS